MDGLLDDIHRQFIAQILESHAAGTIDLQVAVQLAVVARFYERLGDHAVNIANRIRYIATGVLPEHEAAPGSRRPERRSPKGLAPEPNDRDPDRRRDRSLAFARRMGDRPSRATTRGRGVDPPTIVRRT